MASTPIKPGANVSGSLISSIQPTGLHWLGPVLTNVTTPHPIPDGFMDELWRYREAMQLDPWPETLEPLVLSLSGRNPVTSRFSKECSERRVSLCLSAYASIA